MRSSTAHTATGGMPTVTEVPLRLEPVTPDPFLEGIAAQDDADDPHAHARQRARVLASLVAVPRRQGDPTLRHGWDRP